MNTLQIVSMIISILFLLGSGGALSYSIYQSVFYVKDKRVGANPKPYLKKVAIALAVFATIFPAGLCFIYPWNNYSATSTEWLSAIFGGLFFALFFGSGLCSFIIHYYKKGLNEKLDKYLFINLIASIPLSVIFFLLTTDGFADMCGENFIFPNGLNFTKGFVAPTSGIAPNITFYAICILSGAVFVYFLSDHYMYKEYGKHGTIETTFLFALPSGILGARIAYVIGNWTREGFAERIMRGEWWSIFAMWEGGLTILGGAIAGIAVGVLVYIKTNKGRSIWTAVDLIVPTILLAQAIGRWGNFFNCEVHGAMVDENAWLWLPKIIFNNAHYSSAKGLGFSDPGTLYVPLFFIEFLTNILGYFVIAHVFGKKFKNILRPGDLASGYLIWYGLTRIFMEPLRHPSFKMGEKDFWSWTWAIVFVVVGCLFIFINHIVRYKLEERKGNAQTAFNQHSYFLSGGIVATLSVASIVTGIILMCNNEFFVSLEYNAFNIGIILLALGVSLLFIAMISCYMLIKAIPIEEDNA